jgi:hypothetical protein
MNGFGSGDLMRRKTAGTSIRLISKNHQAIVEDGSTKRR